MLQPEISRKLKNVNQVNRVDICHFRPVDFWILSGLNRLVAGNWDVPESDISPLTSQGEKEMRELNANEIGQVSGASGFWSTAWSDAKQIGEDFVGGSTFGGTSAATSRVVWNAAKTVFTDASVGLVDGAPEGGIIGGAVGGLIGLGVGIYQVF